MRTYNFVGVRVFPVGIRPVRFPSFTRLLPVVLRTGAFWLLYPPFFIFLSFLLAVAWSIACPRPPRPDPSIYEYPHPSFIADEDVCPLCRRGPYTGPKSRCPWCGQPQRRFSQ